MSVQFLVKVISELRDATCQWDHTVLSATPAGQVGTRFIDPVRMNG